MIDAIVFSYTTIYGILTFLPQQFPLLAREYHDGLYPVSISYIATVSQTQ
jgi:hypothetical protein